MRLIASELLNKVPSLHALMVVSSGDELRDVAPVVFSKVLDILLLLHTIGEDTPLEQVRFVLPP